MLVDNCEYPPGRAQQALCHDLAKSAPAWLLFRAATQRNQRHALGFLEFLEPAGLVCGLDFISKSLSNTNDAFFSPLPV